ncbi:Pimeloyl-ACP methyl ester carboxylesterase [Methylobacterium phyllostachyos]|uniref:Palmitoyl-protein thioesterase ABHD10, mitochondrial n=1 Tax=Methylobacterium phyllostachyos TaxID=582672 RepID=A0A1G9WTI9_9HYPH|nr:alpha/beta hydrolase [Methylobacterium phyllostachyos]SDM87581.1 Pimeloyl-ACP methyl ester carboxylesterase [Methylobacterium phyllostachyos]
MTDTEPSFLTVGAGAAERRIALRVRPGSGPPVVWLGGFRSDMKATKATALDQWATGAGRKFVRFDYAAHGESSGTFTDCTISSWLVDAQAVLSAHVDEPPILVGSSMGGWIACLAARERQLRGEKTAGLVLIAPALDFTEDLIWNRLDDAARAVVLRDGVLKRPSDYAPEPDPITLTLIEDGRKNRLLGGSFDPACPVHILQGMQDPDVPYTHALKILEHLPAAGTVLTLIADGDHRLSRPQDIARLVTAVAEIV